MTTNHSSTTVPSIVCESFGLYPVASVEPINNGLINSSYKIALADGKLYFLQQINTSVFKAPLALQMNYLLIEQHLSASGRIVLPKLVETESRNLLFEHEQKNWRCFEFFNHTYTPQIIETPEQAYEVANCFGLFTSLLHNFDSRKLETVLPNFHDLHFRYTEFKASLQQASAKRTAAVAHLIQNIEDNKELVAWYVKISSDSTAYPLHILHHDCKVSNVLFDKNTHTVRCPIDLDTTQPGLFFSDIGDMIRTIVPNKNENDTEIENLQIRSVYFEAVLNGYLDAMAACLTVEEKEQLPTAGMMMIYMQAMRFLTDYLNGDVYYKTEYEDQNKDRAANQLQLLRLLQEFIKDKTNR